MSDPRESLFAYGPEGDWNSFYEPNYTPAFGPNFSSPELEQRANEVCGGNQLCAFDIAATGDVGIGISTLNSVKEQETLTSLFIQSIHAVLIDTMQWITYL